MGCGRASSLALPRTNADTFMNLHAGPSTTPATLPLSFRDRAPLTARIREREDTAIAEALAILKRRLQRDSFSVDSPQVMRDYLIMQLAPLQHEAFYGVFLDARNRVIAAEEMFRGTLMQTSVYPREVVKRGLHHNAATVLFAHNHPGGIAEPSRSDELLTANLQRALALVDIRVLDHFVVAGTEATSFAELGLL